MILLGGDEVVRTAKISGCGAYRYHLSRKLIGDRGIGAAVFILANPSTADENVDDATVRKCWGYTRRWGLGEMVFVNVNPYRSTDPKKCQIPGRAVMRRNDEFLRAAAKLAHPGYLVAAWGTVADPVLADHALRLLADSRLHALDVARLGTPKHPLYLPGDLEPRPIEDFE